MKKIKPLFKKNKTEAFIIIFSLLFSSWLMFSTFSYENGNMLIASKAWSDFASHIPLIRSFSFGNNFPPQYPLFSGPPIKYHFLLYASVGILEKFGIRIDYALNILSALGFFFLMVIVYLFAREVFKSRAVAFLSVFFFLFNSSLDFLNFFKVHPFSSHTLLDIISNQRFISFGPYDGRIISAFGSLNIYTNQRHLALSYAFSLFLIYLILRFNEKDIKKNIRKSFIIGIVLGLSFFLNIAVFLMTVVVFACIFLFSSKKRIYILTLLVVGGIIAFPQYLYIQTGGSFKPFINPGYLVTSLNIYAFVNYWWQNLGLNLIFIPLGFIIAAGNQRKIFLSFLALFIIGNLIQFSPEIAANHKFFNFFIIVGAMFSANFIVTLWKKNNLLKPLLILFTFLLIFSGIIDLFPILNDEKITLADYKNSPDILWAMKNTKPNSVFLNAQYLYDDASLAGRKIFLGWPYFPWSQGYDTNNRAVIRERLLTTDDKKFACSLLKKNKIDYVEISPITPNADNPQISDMYRATFISVYKNSASGYNLLSVKDSCK